MAYQKLQVGRAINVIPSDDINIPSPSAVSAEGVNESVDDKILDSTKNFINSVKLNDTVYNLTTNEVTYVTEIIAPDEVKVADSIFSIGDQYKIFSTVDVKTEPCVLYVGSKGTLRVTTSSGDEVTFVNIQDGSFIPVQVLKVFSTGTTASNIVALW
jgi:hypothetical protein